MMRNGLLYLVPSTSHNDFETTSKNGHPILPGFLHKTVFPVKWWGGDNSATEGLGPHIYQEPKSLTFDVIHN